MQEWHLKAYYPHVLKILNQYINLNQLPCIEKASMYLEGGKKGNLLISGLIELPHEMASIPPNPFNHQIKTRKKSHHKIG